VARSRMVFTLNLARVVSVLRVLVGLVIVSTPAAVFLPRWAHLWLRA
jgi:hypothetical protein